MSPQWYNQIVPDSRLQSLAEVEVNEKVNVPFEPEVNCFTFLTATLPGLICLVLYVYQAFVGLRSGQLALITQSVDSRNHVIVAAGVTAGLVASLLQFGLLDTLVVGREEWLSVTDAGREHLRQQR